MERLVVTENTKTCLACLEPFELIDYHFEDCMIRCIPCQVEFRIRYPTNSQAYLELMHRGFEQQVKEGYSPCKPKHQKFQQPLK